MAVRSDISIDWNSSPRVINITSESTELTIQDLVDTCREREERLINMDNPYLVDAAGKEYLGGTTYVGITVTLKNAVVAFKARPGPDWVLCSIQGGNLVAVDDSEPPVYIDVRKPTAYTSCNLTASSSATLQEQSSLQYSSFNGGITVDVVNGTAGVEFPTGTSEQPVNNLDDARAIASERGFELLYIIGNITFGTGDTLSDFEVVGQNFNKTLITINAAANIYDCEFSDANVVGVLDGSCVFKDCMLSDLDYYSGVISRCILLPGTITLGGGNPAHFLDCWSGDPGVDVPTIDMGGSGQSLALQNYNGALKLTNKNGDEEVIVTLNSGEIEIASTVTNGDIYLRGVGEVVDNSTGTAVVDSLSLLSAYSITAIHWKEVYVDTNSTVSGTAFPIGTSRYAVNNLSDGIAIATRENLGKFFVNGNITLTEDVSGYHFEAFDPFRCVIDFNNVNVINASFDRCGLSGVINGPINCVQCGAFDISNMSGTLKDSIVTSGIEFAENSFTYLVDTTAEGFGILNIDMNKSAKVVALNCEMSWEVTNMTDAAASITKTGSGNVFLGATNTAGFVAVGTSGKIIDTGQTGLYIYDDTTRSVVWDELSSRHSITDSFGKIVSDSESVLLRSVGLMQENYYLDQTVYTTYQGAKLLTSGRIRIYSNGVSVGTDDDVVSTYSVTSEWSGDELQTYKVVKQ